MKVDFPQLAAEKTDEGMKGFPEGFLLLNQCNVGRGFTPTVFFVIQPHFF